MNQPGPKHASAEPTRVENKRERRRGAAGRAAALRRAPSDSDCSGETASLSADSGDRVVRPQPPPPRSGKSRSRRRGSEWEVLEGLKDGQRFEKRPDVFNGYLHKKRKWPLKGWHKRFFVIDGGILVYARSPTDVARGRLHGSVDVGLSVISAKARRRRIDIDADEFIYHLRAKTPDVFRTWLNVLKAHRLYRQHLLTFGARESVPKIHAPLDDMPPTDTSSRTSSSATDSSQINYCKDCLNLDFHCPMSKQNLTNRNTFLSKDISVCHCLADQETTDKTGFIYNKRLYSMNCSKMMRKGLKNKHSPEASQESTDGERQMHASDLNSLKIVDPFEESSAICKISLNSDKVNRSVKTNEVFSYSNAYKNSIHSKLMERKQEATTSLSIFTHNAIRSDSPDSLMRRSKKSTNLVKYRNYLKEPTLKRPLSNCMLLTKYKLKVKHIDTMRYRSRAIACDPVTKVTNEIQVNIESKEDKGIQYEITGSECNRITEQLMISLFDTHISTGKGDEVKYYVNQIVKDLYEIKRNNDLHPVKAIFRTLLEYWLKNTSISQVKEAMTRSKSISKQSNRFFTKDEYLSSCVIDKTCKQTQYHGFSELKCNKNKVKQICNRKKNERKNPPKYQSPKRDTESFEKERRVQELERLLKNTVYMCDAGNNQSREKDIKITKTLIDNLGKLSRGTKFNKSNNSIQNDASNSSAEVPKIQDTIDRLISETSLPPDVAKDFFNAYLGVLLHDSSKSVTNTSTQSSDNIDNTDQPDCDVQAETVTRRLSKSVLTSKTNINKSTSDKVNVKFERTHPFDDGQQYLKEVLDKITTIFSKIRNSNNKWFTTSKIQTDTVASKVNVKDELGKPVSDFPGKNLIHHDYDENSVVIDLTRYDLKHIAMFSDPAVKGNMSVTIKLKEKPINTGIPKRKQLSLKLSDGSKSPEFGKENNWIPYINVSDISCRFNKIPIDVNKNSYIECPANDLINLKPYLSSSEATSKACRIMHESDHSLDLSFKSSRSIHKEMLRSNKSIENEGTQSCFIMSTLKKQGLRNKVQSKKKVRLKECHGVVLNSSGNSIKLSITGQTNEARPVFEKSEPNIIDEKFIFLMLNNLSLLSRNAPSLNKDIKNLYLKLKTKYEQVVQNDSNVQGLSLLGKIYTEESLKLANVRQTQTDIIIGPLLETCVKGAVSVGTNTNKMIATRSHNIMSIDKDRSDIGVETEEMLKLNKYEDDGKKCTSFAYIPQTDIVNNIASNVSTGNKMKSTEQGTSNQDWFKRTNECGINTALRYIFNNNRSDHFRTTHAAKTVQLDREFMKKNRNISPKLFPSSLNMSMQCQTYWKSNTSVKETEKEFKTYQLSLGNQYPVVKLSSLTTLCTKEATSDDLKTLYRCSSDPSYCSGLISPTSPPIRGPQFVSGTPGGRLASWIIESGGPLENASRELGQAQLSIQQMQRLLDALEMQQQVHHDTDVSIEGASPNVKKDRRKFGLRKKKSNSKCASVELAPPHVDISSSHMALSTLTAPPSPGGGASSAPNSAASLPIACAAARPQSLPGTEVFGTTVGPTSLTSLTPDHQLREDFTVLAKDLLGSLKTIVATLICERGRLRAAMEASDPVGTPGGSVMAALRTNLTSALQQNSELRSRLSRIHLASDIAEISSVGANSDPQGNRQFQPSLSYSSSCVSASEFFDAEEHEDDDLKTQEVLPGDETGVIELDGDSSSEAGSLSSEEGSASSDNSDGAMLSAEQDTLRVNANGLEPRPGSGWNRRTRLPATRPTPGGPSLWNLLYKNIGKDLSQISMPVTINEPLNMLQRLCEELEYCSLLDSAAACGSAAERMALVAAFAVSAYAASAHRAASKPFNPLLAETYECRRDDRAFFFLAEQVSHHPPISACHAESPRWCFWQEARIKTKFWGKSMEFQPTGRVHVRLTTTGDHYSWNKVTTCVHNLFGGQRWVDQYGDMHITCHGTDIGCKLNFIKASSWSSTRHEVRGVVTAGSTRLRLSGRWSEALYAGDPPAARCLWRPGAMPPEHELYYGFTRFAMELNELEPGMRDELPHTDTRLRPDQRALEEGDVETAEQLKHELEQAQRDRRRDSPTHKPAWFRKTVESGEETWVFTGEYWKSREAGFPDLQAPRIW